MAFHAVRCSTRLPHASLDVFLLRLQLAEGFSLSCSLPSFVCVLYLRWKQGQGSDLAVVAGSLSSSESVPSSSWNGCWGCREGGPGCCCEVCAGDSGFRNVDVVGKAEWITYLGSSNVAITLRAAAIMLKLDSGWDWFITLSARDYPLITQDGMPILSFLFAPWICVP
uniref:Uncharacterized protein n=1 Tax=Lotus japonicus TaxID=34305 RepID=I3STW6_LOTJA|nr:unknown [Lotus japonicus]